MVIETAIELDNVKLSTVHQLKATNDQEKATYTLTNSVWSMHLLKLCRVRISRILQETRVPDRMSTVRITLVMHIVQTQETLGHDGKVASDIDYQSVQ